MMSTGSKIKGARVSRGLVQRELAEMVGVEPGTISRWENDEVEPDPRNLLVLAKALGKNPEWFAIDVISDEISEIKTRLQAIETRALIPSSDQVNPEDQKYWTAWQATKEKWRRDIALFFLTGNVEEITDAVPKELRKRLLDGLRFHKMTPNTKGRAPKR